MARNHAFYWRLGFAIASWGAVVGSAQLVAGADIGRAARELEQRIEHRVRGIAAPADVPPGGGTKSPERSHEDESLQPWELVSV
jgi:hypothetical protein